jgi:hypothetical protein
LGKWTLNEEQAKKIVESEPIKITESEVFNDLTLPKKERIKNAQKIIKSRKYF